MILQENNKEISPFWKCQVSAYCKQLHFFFLFWKRPKEIILEKSLTDATKFCDSKRIPLQKFKTAEERL